MGVDGSLELLIPDCYIRSEVPGRTIGQFLGLVQYTKKGIAEFINLNETEMFKMLLQIAKKNGANAVVNIRIATSFYPYQEGQGLTQKIAYYYHIIAYGEAVYLT